MTDLKELINEVEKRGYGSVSARARVCQDIILKAISKSQFSRNVTIKGGVVMRSITGDARRATLDMDLDFIRYSLSEDSIRKFMDRLNCLDDLTMVIDSPIAELSQQEYRGKRFYIKVTDRNGFSLRSKIDLGVHKNIEQIEQEEYCFDVCLDDEGASLLINSKEQIFAEKLRSLLRFGTLSTRYKDIYDLSFLSENIDNADRMNRCLNTYILDDTSMREKTMDDVIENISRTFSNKNYMNKVRAAKDKNWTDNTVDEAVDQILSFLTSLKR